MAAANDPPIGAPADRVAGDGHQTTVSGDTVASVAIDLTQAANYPDCTQVAASGFNVYLPDDTARLFVPVEATGCSNPDLHLLKVKRFGAD